MSERLSFQGSQSEFLTLLRRIGRPVEFRELADKTRFIIDGANIDWWPESRNKSVHVSGSNPQLVDEITEFIRNEISETQNSKSVIGTLRAIESWILKHGGTILKSDQQGSVRFSMPTFAHPITVSDEGDNFTFECTIPARTEFTDEQIQNATTINERLSVSRLSFVDGIPTVVAQLDRKSDAISGAVLFDQFVNDLKILSADSFFARTDI